MKTNLPIKKIVLILFVLIVISIPFLFKQKSQSLTTADDIIVTQTDRINFKTIIDSNIVWVPGEKNSVAALHSYMEGNKENKDQYQQQTVVYTFNLETQKHEEIYALGDYGISMGNGEAFFWSTDNHYLITDTGGIVDLDQETGYWLKLPEELSSFSIHCLSQSGNKLFVSGGNGDFSGSYIVNLVSGEFEEFKINLDGFTPPLLPAVWDPVFYPLAWSPDEEWFVIETYDPENPPKDYTDVVSSALYMLSKDGSEAKLIIRDIKGRVISVVFSPDGSKIAWVEQYADGNQSIHIANSDVRGAHEIFSNTGLPSDYNITSDLIWSPDGNRLVFVGYRSKDFVYPFWVLTLGQAETN